MTLTLTKDLRDKIVDEEYYFTLIKKFFSKESGIKLTQTRENILFRELKSRITHKEVRNMKNYYYLLLNDYKSVQKEEYNNVLTKITVNETSFFRDRVQYDFIKSKILPIYKNKNDITILSLPCSTGEETYSLGMVIYDYFGFDTKKKITITGMDIDKKAIYTAIRGKYKYSYPRFKNMPAGYFDKYFTKQHDGNLSINEDLRKKMIFFQSNIIKDRLIYKYDIIFLKNLLIYFNDTDKKNVINKMYKNLNDNGYLFMGGTEIFSFMSKKFKKIVFGNQFIYQKNNAMDNDTKNDFAYKTHFRKQPDILKSNKIMIKQISGFIDYDNPNDSLNHFKHILDRIQAKPDQNIIIDMTNIEFICIECIDYIIKISRILRKNDKDIVFILQNKKILSMMKRLGYDKLINIFDNIMTGRKYFNQISNKRI